MIRDFEKLQNPTIQLKLQQGYRKLGYRGLRSSSAQIEQLNRLRTPRTDLQDPITCVLPPVFDSPEVPTLEKKQIVGF